MADNTLLTVEQFILACEELDKESDATLTQTAAMQRLGLR